MKETGEVPGTLLIVGTPIGNLGDLSPRAIQALAEADLLACEDTRRTRKLLAHAGIPAAERLVAIPAYDEWQRTGMILEALAAGKVVALVSDAGMPLVSDPGRHLVEQALEAGASVRVVPGPSAVLGALALSGMAADRFCFEGFLPRKGAERRRRLEVIAAEERPCIIFEAPGRLASTLGELASVCGHSRRAAVSREMTKIFEETVRGSLPELVAWAEEVKPRGECTIVVGGGGATERPGADVADIDDEVIRAELALEVGRGASRRDAVATVADHLGVARGRVYRLMHVTG